MQCVRPSRFPFSQRRLFALGIAALLSTVGYAQVAPTLPPTAPTTPFAAPVAPTGAVTPAQEPPRRARVTYAAGLLTVAADNSSLNGILRDVSRLTGMLISGGVAEERVYGSYGPANPDTVLTALLTGTGSNLLLKETPADAPLELVLTPRQGGPTPPSPASSRGADEIDLPPQQIVPFNSRLRSLGIRSVPSPAAPQPPPVIPTDASAPATTPAAARITPVTPPASPGAGTTTQQSPNGVSTPQQVYDQLLKLQQQKTPPPPPR